MLMVVAGAREERERGDLDDLWGRARGRKESTRKRITGTSEFLESEAKQANKQMDCFDQRKNLKGLHCMPPL